MKKSQSIFQNRSQRIQLPFSTFTFFTCLFFSLSTCSTQCSSLFLCFFLYDLSLLFFGFQFRVDFFVCVCLVFSFFENTALLFFPFLFIRSLYFFAFSLVGTLTYAYAKKDKNESKKEKYFTSLFNIECPLNLTRISAPLVFSKGTIRRERSAERYRKLYMDRTRIRRSKNLCRGFSISWSQQQLWLKRWQVRFYPGARCARRM